VSISSKEKSDKYIDYIMSGCCRFLSNKIGKNAIDDIISTPEITPQAEDKDK
jgi:hypothetical protein